MPREAQPEKRAGSDLARPTGGKPPLDELIPDHALPADAEDLFDHDDYVNSLVAVIDHASTQHTSANVALFGSWGSGKSGVANRLRARLGKRSDLHYADFDAFKFARDPLLRNFLLRLARELLGKSDAKEVRRRLYETTNSSRLELPVLPQKWKRALALFAFVSLFLLGLSLGFVLLGNDGLRDFGSGFFTTVLSLASSAVLIALITFAVRRLTVTTTTSPAGSEEQFEEIFNWILEKLEITGDGKERLVVFIDELDRCSPADVAATLESIRTFLGVKGCIFVVAADQQVLEHALTQQVRQSTPRDLVNPYYSAGNAYLDKIFQYQLAFPPLRPRRLTRYALDLIEGRGGVWAEADVNHEEVVSVLLPTHVQSPRRVKVLLNGFALSYRVGKARAARESLPTIAPRAAELAKLVCLRIEFPLFARDLNLDPRLTQAVVVASEAMASGANLDDALKAFPVDVRQKALLYARGELPAAQLLSGRDDADGREAPRQEPDGGPEEEAEQDGVPHGNELEIDEESIQARHAVQLVRYLEKTADIDGPGSDLIFLESPGAVWGLEAQVAQDLEQDAIDNRAEAVAQAVRDLDSGDRPKALLMLGRLARESVGTDADNAVRCLLGAVAVADVPLEPTAGQLVGDLEAYEERRGLGPDELPGAFVLALGAKRKPLVADLLNRDEALTDPFIFTILGHAQSLSDHQPRIAEILARAMAVDNERTAPILKSLPEDLASRLLAQASPHVIASTETHRSEADRLGGEGDAEGSERERQAVSNAIAELLALASVLLEHKQGLAELAALPLFGIVGASESSFSFVEEAKPLRTEQLSLAVLQEMAGLEMENVQRLVVALAPEVVGKIESAPQALDRFAAHAWNELRGTADSLPDELQTELKRITSEGLEPAGGEASAAIAADLVRRIDTDPSKDEFNRMEALAVNFSEAAILRRESVATPSMRAVTESVAPPPPPANAFEIAEALRGSVGWLAKDAANDALHEALAAIGAGDCWVEPIERHTMELYLLAALRQAGEEVDAPTLDELNERVETGVATSEAAGVWVEAFAANPREAADAVATFVAKPSKEMLDSLRAFSAELSSSELAELASPLIGRAFMLKPTKPVLDAIRFSEASDLAIADTLVDLGDQAGNQERREQVLDIWGWLEPSSPGARKKLIFDVFLPIAEAGATSHDLARRRLELVADPPSGTRDDIIRRLAASAPDKDRAKKLERRLTEVGLSKRRKGFIRRLFDSD